MKSTTKRETAALVGAIVRPVSLLVPRVHRKTLREVYGLLAEFANEVLMAPDPPEIADILNRREESSTILLQFAWGVIAAFDPELIERMTRDRDADYRTERERVRPPRIGREAKAAHDDAFALIAASRVRARMLRREGVVLPEHLAPRLTRVVVDVEVLSLAVQLAMTRKRKARSVAQLEGVIYALFDASLYLYAFVSEAASVASAPTDAVRQRVETFQWGDRVFHLRESVDVDVASEDGGFVAYMHVVPLSAAGSTPGAAVVALAEVFAATWDALAWRDRSEMSLDAQALGLRLRELVETAEAG